MTVNDIIAASRSWIGTPYHHQASVKGVGCDCLGLVRGVYAELYGASPEEPPPYSRDLAEATGRETLIEAARRHLVEVAPGDAGPGDVVIFRLRPGAMAKHCAIISFAPGIRPASAHLAVGPKENRLVCHSGPAAKRANASADALALAKMIHAFEGGPVCEVHLSPWWRRRIATAFRFPVQESPDVQSLRQP